jgi:hypothetical protein
MKKLAFTILLAVFASSCHNSTDGGNAPQSIFLNNYTFDSSGYPSLSGWLHNNSDVDSTAHFVKDAPPGLGGTWSVALFPGWVPFKESVERSFFGLQSGVYQLTAWTTTLQRNKFNLSGAISISKLSGAKSESRTLLTGDTNVWHPISLLDTMTLAASDTVLITLSGSSCEVCPIDSLLFNNITFQKLE